jgi:tetratricopeptide (TPR) repeat protein
MADTGQQTVTIEQALDLAVQHHNAGRMPEAENIFQQILQIDPNQPVALHLLGVITFRAGEHDLGVDLITRALAIKPDYVDALFNLGTAFQKQGKLDEAVASYRQALAIKPEFAEAHFSLGNALKEQGELEEAVDSYYRALAIEPDHVMAHNSLGITLMDQGRLDEAVSSYSKALAIEPDFAAAQNNLGNALNDLGKLDEAVASYHKALAIKPDYVDAHFNLGNAFKVQGKLDEAAASYYKAVTIKPDFAEAHSNLGFALLDLGRDLEGLEELEWRWKTSAYRQDIRDFDGPEWTGAEDLNGRTILLWPEQGVGDNLNWASCLSRLIAQAGHCIVEVPPKIVTLLARSFPSAVVRAENRGSQATDIDFHLPFGSLYHRLYPNIDYPAEAYLIPDPGRVAFWKNRLAELGPGPHIGVSWKSSLITPRRAPNYPNIAEWAPIFSARDAVFVNLQYGEYENDLAVAKRDFGAPLHTFDDLDVYNDLDNVAALSKALDLNITVDNIEAVISAGVGTPTWVLTWRQSNFSNFARGPRGPSVTRFERNTGEPWDAAFQKIAECLKLRAGF